MMNSNAIGNVELKVTLSKQNITNEAFKIFKDYQKEVDKNTITYKIAGDKSNLESMLKEIQGFTPELLTKLKLDFDKSDYDKEMNLLKNASGKTAMQIGSDFKESITNSLKGFSISEIIGKDLGKNGKITTKDIPKLKETLQNLMSQTNNFDLGKATSVKEINEQVIALSKMKVILEALSKYSDQKAIKIDGKNLNIAEMLKNNTSQIDSIMNNVGSVIKTNASQWAMTLETTFNNEFTNIISLFNHLQDIINGTFNSGSSNMFGQATKDMKNLQVEIDKTTKDIEELENKLSELQSKNKPQIAPQNKIDDARRGVTNFANNNNVYLDKNNKRYNEEYVEKFKQVVNEYMVIGGKLEDIKNNIANKYIKLFDIQQILPPIPENISQEITRITNELELLKNKRNELILQQQNLPKDVTGSGQGIGGGSGTGGQGTPTKTTVSPTLSPTFKEDLQKLVDATGSVNTTVSGKLSETFLTDLQTNADSLGNVKVGVDFGKKDGTQSQEILVDVITTPKLSETFKDDLQKVIDETGKYTITIGTSENKQTDLVPIKASVENGEEFRDQLKQTVEGTDGLDVKVKPVISDDFQLEINNAVLKDVKVEGTIQGGNLKPDSVETPVKDSPTAPSIGEVNTAPIEAIKEGLKGVKQSYEEVDKAAEKSGEQQSSSVLKVIKEITQLRKEQEEVRKIANAPIENKDLLDYYYSKRSKYSNLDKDALAKEINSHYNEINRDSGESNVQKIWTTIIALVDRYKKVAGTAFNFSNENAQNELLERRKSIYEKLQKAQEKYNEVKNAENRELTLSHNLSGKAIELGNLSKTTSEVEKLESELFELVETVEKLKASSKTGLINIDAKKNGELKTFFEKWKEYKTLGGTGNISDFTNEVKVINTVNEEYNKLKSSAEMIRTYFSALNPDININQFNEIFTQIETGALTAEKATEKLKASIQALRKETEKQTTQPDTKIVPGEQKPADANKPVKLEAKGEINVVPKIEDPAVFTSEASKQLTGNSAEINVAPKVEDPVGFANQVTEQLKGQSAKIDIKPNIIWDNAITSNSQDATKNKEIDSKINSYNRMIELMNEYIKLQKTVAQGNKDIVETYDNGRFFNVNSSDTTRATDYIKPTKVSLKRRLDSYLNAEKNEFGIYNEKTIANEKEKLASYVAAFNNADEAQKIFGRNNKALFTEIQTMIENAKVSLDAYQTSQAKLSGALHNAYDISTKDSWTLSERNNFESILNTGNIEKAVQYLQKHLGLQIPKAAQQAKTAIDGIGEQIQQEGQESKSKPIQIPISLEANIESLNTSLQSKKEQILPVDVKINAVPITNTSTNVGTTGMTYEAEQAEALRNKIVEVTTAVDNKTNAFRQEEQVVNGTVQSEITMLEVLDGQLNIIFQDIQKIIENPLKINIDYSSIEQLSQVDENGKSSIDKLKASIAGLQTGVLSDLGKAFSGLQLPNGVSGKIENLAKALESLKTSLSGIDSGSIGFLDSVKDLAVKAEGLKDLATVIRASKEEIQKAKDEINNTGTKSENKSQATDKEKYTILKDTLKEVLRLTKEYNKERNSETKSDISSQIQLYKNKADSLQLELYGLEKINEVEQNRIDIIQEQIKAEEQKQRNKELSYIQQQINSMGYIEEALSEQYLILEKDSNEWKHALELLSLYKDELKDVVKITRNINVDKNTGFKAISYQFTDSSGSTKTVGADSNLLMDNTKIADLNKLYSQLNLSANTYYSLQTKIVNGDTSSKIQTESLIAYNNMVQAQKDIAYWKEKGLVPSREQLQIEEKIASINQTLKEQEQISGLQNMYTTVLNTIERLNTKQKEVNELKLKADGTKEFAESIQNAQNNVSLLIGTLRGFKFEDFFTTDALSSLGLNGSSLLFTNDDLNSLRWVINQLPLTEEQIQKINDALDKNTLIKEKNIAAQNKLNIEEQKNSNEKRVLQANENYKMIESSLVKQYNLTKEINQLEKNGNHEKAKLLNAELVEEIRNCDALVAGYRTFNDIIADVDVNLAKLFSDSKNRFGLLRADNLDDLNKQKYSENLSVTYAHADENVKRENEYLEKRNKLLKEGKAQSEAYYKAQNKERQDYIKFWENADYSDKKFRGISTRVIDESLQQTEQLMQSVFKPNVEGFENAFNRAKNKIKNLNEELKKGNISDVQTGYVDKVNKIIQELRRVVGVTKPLGQDPKVIEDVKNKMIEYASTINNGNVSIGNFNEKTNKMIVTFEKQKGVLQEIELSWNSVTGEISAAPGKIKKTQSTLTTFIDGIKARFRSLIQYLSIFVSYYRIIGMIKNGINVVRELDTALTEMRKVSDETVQSLKKFQGASFDIAKSVGTTAKQIQESTADFMRLGNP